MRLGVEAALVHGELVPGDVSVEDGRVVEVGLSGGSHGLIAIPGLVDIQNKGQFFLRVAMRGALPQKRDGAIRLHILVVRPAAAGAGAIVVLPEFFLERIQVRNALRLSVGAECRLRRLLCAKPAGAKHQKQLRCKDGESLVQNSKTPSTLPQPKSK